MVRRLPIALTAFATSCFSPTVDDSQAGGSENAMGATETSTDTGETTASTDSRGSASGTSSVDDADTGGSETSVGVETSSTDDQPPTFDSFTVNGSTSPPEVTLGGSIELNATVTDDDGVASVEFYDGDTSIGLVESPPFELELSMTSIDSGMKTYRAVALDTAGQATESDSIGVSINIVGGTVEVLRENLFVGSDFLNFFNGRISRLGEGRVVATGNLPNDVTGGSVVLVYNEDLSLIAESTLERSAPSGATAFGDEAIVPLVDTEAGSWSYRALNPATGALGSDAATFDLSGFDLFDTVFPRSANSGTTSVLGTSPNALRAVDDGGATLWDLELVSGAVVFDIAPYADGSFAVSYRSASCASGTDACVRRVNAAGDTMWTRGLLDEGLHSVAVNDSSLLYSASSTGVVAILDETGESLADSTLDVAAELRIRDIAAAGDGCVLAVSTGSGTAAEAGVLLLDTELQTQWFADDITPGFAANTWSVVATDDAVFGLGIASVEEGDFGVKTGDAWVARLTL